MPFTYLGLPVGTTRPKVLELMPLVNGIERKLTTALSLMSMGAKLYLVNIVITSTITYAMCSLKLHPKIIEHLDILRRYCLWAKNTPDGIKNNSLAVWYLVCKLKNKGGLGVINIKIQNTALLLKHLFKFYNHSDTPWVALVWSSYYPNKIPHASYSVGSFWWRNIMFVSDIFRGITSVAVDDGSFVLLWKDLWLPKILFDTYP